MGASRRADDRRSTEQRLLDAAWVVVRDHGLQGASSRTITDAAGVNLGAITYHFGSKDHLIARSLTGQVERWTKPALRALADPAADPMHRLLRAVRLLDEALGTAHQDSAVLIDALAAARHLPVLQGELQALFAELRARLAVHLADPAFGLPDWVRPDVYAGLLVAIGTGLAITAILDPDAPATTAMSSQLANTLLAARTPPSPPARAKPARTRAPGR
jgi:AcrR family transcriptional regulator